MNLRTLPILRSGVPASILVTASVFAHAQVSSPSERESAAMHKLLTYDRGNAKQSGEIQKELARIANEKAKLTFSRALQAYAANVAAKVKSKLVLPPGVSGNPVGRFQVAQQPDGTVTEVSLKRSTGNAQLDAAIERAILESSPLPTPKQPELFQPFLLLEFHPLRD